MQVRGKGNAGMNGGPAGDLHVVVSVRPDPIFERDGYDVTVEVPITYMQAVLGDDIVVPSIDGKKSMNIPEGTQSGKIFRLKGLGIQKLQRSNERGDQYVRVIVEVPKNLNKTQKDLLRKFEDSLGESNYKSRKNFFDKIKDILKNDIEL